jgi:hypothetical protein
VRRWSQLGVSWPLLALVREMEKERQAAVDRAEEWMTGREPPREQTVEVSGNALYAVGMRLEINGEPYRVVRAQGNQLTIIEAPEE